VKLSRVSLIGCGHMGGALLARWIENFPEVEFDVVAPSGLNERFAQCDNIVHHSSLSSVLLDADLIVLGVKPQIMPEVLKDLGLLISRDYCVVSIAAGLSIENIVSYLSPEQPVVRVMPNMPCALGVGVSVGVANRSVSDGRRVQVANLFAACGVFDWADDEGLLHAVTGVSGSGPAYLYYVVEALETAAIAAGLSAELARVLARQTVVGSAAVLADSDLSPADLRAQVTSKAGTTEAGLRVLMDGRLDDVLAETVAAAVVRSRELGE